MAIKTIKYGLKLFIQTCPVFFWVVHITGILNMMSWGASTVATQWFFDSVGDVITNNEPLRRVYLMIIVVGALLILKQIIEGIHNFLYGALMNKPSGAIRKVLHTKMARLDPICFEDSKFYDSIKKADSGVSGIMGIVAYLIVLFSSYLPYLIFMSFYMHSLKPSLLWIIVLIFIPTLISQILRIGIIAKFEDTAAPIKREYDYYEKTIADRSYYKETRKLGIYQFFIIRFINSIKNLSKAEWDRNKRINLIELAANLTTAAGYAGILYILISNLLSGDISAGAFAAVFASIGTIFGIMSDVIDEGMEDIVEGVSTGQNFIRFMELPERSGLDAAPDFDKGIVAANMSFIYPNAKHKSIDNVSLEIKAGETIAVVGANGAGKTTLVKLLIGLYIPTSGKVVLNGMKTSETNNKSLFAGTSGVFQNFQRYQMTLDENVKISDVSSDSKTDLILMESGVDFENSNTFPAGKDTMLSREFGGVDLSGGQWQRVAIARGLYRRHDVIVLDEPTAAIDPIEESRIYRKFAEISKDKTAIIVTHRLGSTKIADRVIVMDKGKIIDIGLHDELLEKCSLYKDMFNAQAVWYENISQK